MNGPEMIAYVVAALLIVFGLVECFYGFKIFNVVLRILGFIFGGLLCGGLAMLVNPWFGLIAGIVGAFVGAFLAVPLHCVGVFFMGAVMGAMLSAMALALVGMTGMWLAWIPLAVICGILALTIRRPIIIISTAMSGAATIAGALITILVTATQGIAGTPRLDNLELSLLTMVIGGVAWLVLTIVGSVFQFRSTSDMADRPKPVDYRQNTVLGH